MPIGAAFAFVEFAAQCDAGGTNAARLILQCESNGVIDCAGGDFVIAHKPRENT